MDFLNWLFENKIVEMIASGFVGLFITLLFDPPKAPSIRQTYAANEMTVTQVNINVQRHIYHRSAEDDRKEVEAIIALQIMAVLGMLVAIIFYGAVVVQLARFLVAVTGFASLFLGIRVFGSPAFRPSSWIIRVATIIAVCVVLWLSLDYVADSITASIVYAQRIGYNIRNIPDLFRVLGAEGTFDLVFLAFALVIAVGVSVMAMAAQLHMLLAANAATASDPQDWRVRLLAFMGNWSGARVFIPMILLSLLSLGIASDWLQTLGRVPGG